MRAAFIRTLTAIAENEPRIILLTADLGYLALEPFVERFPERFFNCGVAEQNMVGMATGLAEAGFIPFVYSIVNFATLRPYEFIRNGPILHRLPVRIVGVGGGIEYGPNGSSHLGLEDVGVFRVQPAITIVAPADSGQTATALSETWDLPQPVYYRLGKDDKLTVPGLDGRFRLAQLQCLRNGDDVAFVCLGSVVTEAVAAAGALEQEGISSAVAVVSGFNPDPAADLIRVLTRHRVVITVEAHYLAGALGSLVAELIASNGLPCRLVRCGIATAADGRSGSQQYFYRRYGLSAAELVKTARAATAALAAHP